MSKPIRQTHYGIARYKDLCAILIHTVLSCNVEDVLHKSIDITVSRLAGAFREKTVELGEPEFQRAQRR